MTKNQVILSGHGEMTFGQLIATTKRRHLRLYLARWFGGFRGKWIQILDTTIEQVAVINIE